MQLTTHSKQFNVAGKREVKQGLEESPPRQKGAGWEEGALVPSLTPPQLCWNSGQVAFLSGFHLPCSPCEDVSAEVRLMRVGSRVRALCPQRLTVTAGPGQAPGALQWGRGAPAQLGSGGPPDPCQPGYWVGGMVSVGPLGFGGGLRLQGTGPGR